MSGYRYTPEEEKEYAGAKAKGMNPALVVPNATQPSGMMAGLDNAVAATMAANANNAGTGDDDASKVAGVTSGVENGSADGASGASGAPVDNLSFFTDYIKKVGYTEDDRIADEKRKNAARWITAAQALGDSIGALGNVYWAGQGANAQQVAPGAAAAGAATYQLAQDIRNAQQKAAEAELAATAKRYDMEWQRKMHEDNLALKRDEMRQSAEQFDKTYQAGREDASWEKEYKKQTLELEREIAQSTKEQKTKALELEFNKLALDRKKYNAATGNVELYFDGQKMSMPYNFVEKNVPNIYGMIPADLRAKYESVVTKDHTGTSTRPISPNAETMMAAITEYSHLPAVSNALRALAGLEPLSQEEVDRRNAAAAEAQADGKGKPKKANPMG